MSVQSVTKWRLFVANAALSSSQEAAVMSAALARRKGKMNGNGSILLPNRSRRGGGSVRYTCEG